MDNHTKILFSIILCLSIYMIYVHREVNSLKNNEKPELDTTEKLVKLDDIPDSPKVSQPSS